MSQKRSVERLLGRFIEHHVLQGTQLSLDELCPGQEELREPLRQAIRRYLDLDETLELGSPPPSSMPPVDAGSLPRFEGFQTIERIGSGGMGEVFKLKDLKLERFVAGKVVRSDARLRASLSDFLNEAKSMALFQDERIVQIFEFRAESTPPVIIMEYVEGFGLNRLGPSLEYLQRARIFVEICEALHHAHSLGIQHRDLKPANILVNAQLAPKILDFGLSGGDPARGHLKGTLPYLAPEQIDPSRPIDDRTDVYALGILLYELLCRSAPYGGETEREVLQDIQQGQPQLPVEVEPTVPEPLQAIALKAMERAPSERYQTAREMALELKRYLEGRPVLARPSLYSSTLGKKLRPHLEQIQEWLRLKLIYPHEAERLQTAYRRLEAREDDWIVESRTLSYSQIALYLGAFLLVAGSLLYFGAHRFFDAVEGLARPLLVLGLPFLGLNLAGRLLYRKEHKAVAVAFYLGGVLLLPLLLLIIFPETNLWVVSPGTEGELFDDGSVSNRQLQVAMLLACVWSAWLAFRTRTIALSSVFTVLAPLFALAVLTDFGLRSWLEEGDWDVLALHLFPLVLIIAFLGYRLEKKNHPWFSRPLYLGGALIFVVVLELLALNGRAFHYLGISMQGFQAEHVSDPLLLDTLGAMSLNGLLIYLVASLLDRYGSDLVRTTAWLLFIISPFAILEPIAYLTNTAEYSRRYDWFYLAFSLAIAVLSHRRQRKSFYYAGLLNTSIALWFITDRYDWYDQPAWAITVIAVGLVVFVAGFGLDIQERIRRRVGS